ncbi:ral guanine nucleotide dissociation stimulator-like [Mus caroli]|uniref:Ral guanine nucleotide dissociation stimulator-like n=1 Tax=Mus caroli TaxID=10089 RepID=A0A6P5PCN8_MUSCR|nr:ral guanine nucleotide dissociation stimulator-like [Mus caroli]
MFSCFQISRGLGPKKPKRGDLGYLWRCLIRPLTHFWHASRRNPKEPDFPYNPPKFTYNTFEFVEQMIAYIPAAVHYHDQLSISLFLAVYHRYCSTWEVLDLLMKTYPSFQPDCEQDQLTKSAIFNFLAHWLDTFPEHFFDSPNLAVMRQLIDYTGHHMPSAEFDKESRELLSRLEEQEAKKLKLEKDCAAIAVQDASRMQENLALRPASVAEPQGDLQPRVDMELLEPAVPTSTDTQSPEDVAIDEAADMVADEAADEAGDVSPAKQLFLSYTVQLGTPDFIFPLPKVDI